MHAPCVCAPQGVSACTAARVVCTYTCLGVRGHVCECMPPCVCKCAHAHAWGVRALSVGCALCSGSLLRPPPLAIHEARVTLTGHSNQGSGREASGGKGSEQAPCSPARRHSRLAPAHSRRSAVFSLSCHTQYCQPHLGEGQGQWPWVLSCLCSRAAWSHYFAVPQLYPQSVRHVPNRAGARGERGDGCNAPAAPGTCKGLHRQQLAADTCSRWSPHSPRPGPG